jgi:hypothetical protein
MFGLIRYGGFRLGFGQIKRLPHEKDGGSCLPPYADIISTI